MNALATAAVECVSSRGWFVFPVLPRGKRPLTKNGVHDASIDVGLVAAWWEETPLANIGVDCGRSHLEVVDLDSREAALVWADIARLHGGHERTLTSRTGDGWHLFFAGTGPSSTGRLGPGIDTRGRGGYAIVPPSIHANGATYRWVSESRELAAAPEWLLKLLDRGLPASEAGERRSLPGGLRYTRYGRVALARIGEELAAAAVGERNETLNAVAYRAGRLCAAGQLAEQVAHDALVAAALRAGLDQGETEATFQSGFKAGLLRPVSLEGRS